MVKKSDNEIRDVNRTCHDIIYKAGAHIKIVIFNCLKILKTNIVLIINEFRLKSIQK